MKRGVIIQTSATIANSEVSTAPIQSGLEQTTVPVAEVIAFDSARSTTSTLRDYLEITRPRISAMVTLTAAAGFVSASHEINSRALASLLVGITLVSAAATVFNQLIERSPDACMYRTRARPLAARRIPGWGAVTFGGVLCAIGSLLLMKVDLMSAVLALFSLAIYDLAYTPLKRLTTLSLYIGAIPGALPPLIGSVAADHAITIRGLGLFACVFIWQLPHFLAIGWLHRDDYRRAGLHVLTVEDPTCARTGLTAVITSVLLLTVVTAAIWVEQWGAVGAFVSVVSALAVLVCAERLLATGTRKAARRLFATSNACLLIIMLSQIGSASLGNRNSQKTPVQHLRDVGMSH